MGKDEETKVVDQRWEKVFVFLFDFKITCPPLPCMPTYRQCTVIGVGRRV